jgi:hypothetical protein
MTPLGALWLPVLLSAVLVFVASSIVHMLLPFHKNDYRKVPREAEVMEALGRFEIPPGDYMMPRPDGMADLKNPEFLEKMKRGPVAMMTIMPGGAPGMGPQLAQWFVYCLVVGLFAGYVASRALPPGAVYLQVFRFVGTVAFVGYAMALWQSTIWYKRSLATTIRLNVDGLIFALLTAGTFGWLWPR